MAFSDTKPHYALLDGLRGVAALLVVWYHVFEGFAFAGNTLIEHINHGYLAVDFFFILSGFVISYAYDDRWAKGFTMKQFFVRRLIRLHPMVIMGALIGTVTFCLQGCVQWDGTHVATSAIMWALLMTICFLPAYPGAPYEVRGNGEMFPLNGPAWSLFFEYIGSLLYALTLHRLSTRQLSAFTICAALAMCGWAVAMADGSIATGWSSSPANATGGLLRMLYGYSMGLLMARLYHSRVTVAGSSGWSLPVCGLVLLLLVCVPHFDVPHFNLLFQLLCVWIAFPLLVWRGAHGQVSALMASACNWLGRLSYPLYAIHYPFIYLYIHWINQGRMPFGCSDWTVAVALFVGCVVLALVIAVGYDEPVRRWLQRVLLRGRNEKI